MQTYPVGGVAVFDEKLTIVPVGIPGGAAVACTVESENNIQLPDTVIVMFLPFYSSLSIYVLGCSAGNKRTIRRDFAS